MQISKRLLISLSSFLAHCANPVAGWDQETFAYKKQCKFPFQKLGLKNDGLSNNLATGVQQTVPSNSTTIPRSFGLLVFPSWEIIDVYGPVQVLKNVAQHYHLNLAIIAETLSPVKPGPRLASANPFNSSFYPPILPTHTLETAPDLDVLIIPGGGGTRTPDLDKLLNYVRTTYPKVKYLITVCTSSLIAGRAGVLDGKRATTNKGAYKQVSDWVPNVKWQPHARWVVDGNVWTSSGLSAGIDITLEFVECIYGEELAARLTEGLELERHTDPRWDPFSDRAVVRTADTLGRRGTFI